MVKKIFDKHIEVDEGIDGGKPRIAGHRITVQNIVIWHEMLGRTADEIAAEYDLTLSDIYAALTYYHDNRSEIDKSIEDSDSFVASLREQIPSKVSQKLNVSKT